MKNSRKSCTRVKILKTALVTLQIIGVVIAINQLLTEAGLSLALRVAVSALLGGPIGFGSGLIIERIWRK